MTKSLMFGFIDFCSSPIAGRHSESAFCGHECCYCYATGIKKDHPEWAKYQGPYRIEEKELNREYPDGSYVFLQNMGEIGDPAIPILAVIDPIARYIAAQPKVTFLLLTKNPQFYVDRQDVLGDLPNIIYGVTLETNRLIPRAVSKAPSPLTRIFAMGRLRRLNPEARVLISVEPIMDFDMDPFVTHIKALHPEYEQRQDQPHVAVGMDNHLHLHPDITWREPSLAKTGLLIRKLTDVGIFVHRKTLRAARL